LAKEAARRARRAQNPSRGAGVADPRAIIDLDPITAQKRLAKLYREHRRAGRITPERIENGRGMAVLWKDAQAQAAAEAKTTRERQGALEKTERERALRLGAFD